VPASIEIRDLDQRNLPALAKIHALAFPGSALTALGASAVRRYYEWQLTGPHDVSALGAFSENEMVGFCFGGVFRGAMSGFLRKNRIYLAWLVLTHPWLVTNPLFRHRLIKGLKVLRRFSKSGRANQPKPNHKKPPFGILSIAVNPEFQGLGAGKVLMAEAEAIARRLGFEEMNLTVNPDNYQAIRFYDSLGWQKITRGSVWSGEMVKTLSI
jgi:ribosomal protein S18 acetylase RimI-like enzyme